MAIILNMYDLPVPVFIDILNHCDHNTSEINQFFLERYEAKLLRNHLDNWQYVFPNKEKYFEFCLQWR